MRGLLILGASLSVGLGLITLPSPTVAQEPVPPGLTRPLGLDELLNRWERQGRTPRLEVTFSQVDCSRKWGDERYEGRLILSTDGRSCFDLERAAGDARTPVERLLRNGHRFYQYRFETKQVFAMSSKPSRSATEQALASKLRSVFVWPLLLSNYGRGDTLPFLFRFNEAEARADYRLELLKETAAEATIKFTPLTSLGKLMCDHVLIQIDKSQWLPKGALLVKPGGKTQTVYRFKALVRQGVEDDDDFEFKLSEGWTLFEVDTPRPMAAVSP